MIPLGCGLFGPKEHGWQAEFIEGTTSHCYTQTIQALTIVLSFMFFLFYLVLIRSQYTPTSITKI